MDATPDPFIVDRVARALAEGDARLALGLLAVATDTESDLGCAIAAYYGAARSPSRGRGLRREMILRNAGVSPSDHVADVIGKLGRAEVAELVALHVADELGSKYNPYTGVFSDDQRDLGW